MVATSPEASAEDNDPNPFRSKFIRLRFYSPIPDLDEGRLIATLRGCIRRRVCYSPYTFYDPIPPDLCLDYRDSEGYFFSDILDPQIRSFCNMNMDKYMDFALTYGEGSFFYWLRVLQRDFVHKARAVPRVQVWLLKEMD